jgi:hypothetical protein
MWKSINCVFNGTQIEHIAVLCAFIQDHMAAKSLGSPASKNTAIANRDI